MATTTTPEVLPGGPTAKPPRITRANNAWPIGFFSLAIFVFVLYQWILPGAREGVQSAFQDWMPLSAVNEAILWVVFALGLNIVVGYSGLLDLGYVAFWAIGGYVAGWLMAPFAFQVTPGWANLKFNLFGNPLPGQDQGIHLSFWLVLPIAAAICAFFGIVIGAPTLRLKSDYLALVTLGFGEIVPQIFLNGDKIGPGGHWNLSNGSQG